MKKGVMLLSILLLFTINLVFAQGSVIPDAMQSIEKVYNQLAEALNPILKYILGDVTPAANSVFESSDLFLIKLLVFILMIAFIYSASQRVPVINESAWLVWVTTFVISILTTRFLSSEALITLVWLPSGVLGISLVSLLPLIIYFFFIEGLDSSVIRKIGWTLFAMVFFSLALIRWDTLTQDGFNLGWIYVITAVVSLLLIYFDRTIRARYFLASIKAKASKENIAHVQRLLDQLDSWEKVRANPRSDSNEVKNAEKAIDRLHKRIADFKAE